MRWWIVWKQEALKLKLKHLVDLAPAMEVSIHLTDWVRLTADNPTAPSQGGSELCGHLVTLIFSTALEQSRHHELPPVYKQRNCSIAQGR